MKAEILIQETRSSRVRAGSIRMIPLVVLAACLASSAFAGDTTYRPLWKFPSGKQYTYRFDQTVEMKSGETGQPPEMESRNVVGGTIRLEGQGDSAKLILEFVPKSMKMGDHEWTDEEMQRMKTQQELSLKADGTLKEGRYGPGGNAQLMIDMLFPLPQQPMSLGKPVKEEMVMFNQGIPPSRGQAIYTLNEMEPTLDGNVLHYDVTFDLKGGEEPTEENGMDDASAVSGAAQVRFNLDRGYFVEVKSSMEMLMNIEFPPMGDEVESKRQTMTQFAEYHLHDLQVNELEESKNP